MTTDRNGEIYRLYTEEHASLNELTEKFQMSLSGICKILSVERARHPDAPFRPPRRSPGQALGEPVSRRHRVIGQRVKWWREQTRKIGLRQASIELSVSTHRLRAIEEGCYAEVGLALLQRLADAIGIDADEFLSENLKPPHEWTRPKG